MIKPRIIVCLVLLLGGMALGGAGLWVLLSPLRYAATVSVKMEQVAEAAPGGFRSDPYFIPCDFEIMQSSLVLSNVVAGLNLNEVWGEKHDNKTPLKYAECYAIIRNHIRFAPVEPAQDNPRLLSAKPFGLSWE